MLSCIKTYHLPVIMEQKKIFILCSVFYFTLIFKWKKLSYSVAERNIMTFLLILLKTAVVETSVPMNS